jgi:hypothetical protein
MTDTNTEHRPNATSDASQKPLSGFDGLVHRLGADKALGLVERLGGTTIRVPVGLQQRPLEQFAKTVGNMHLAKLLVQHYGGTSLYLSSRTAARKLLRNRSICLAVENGVAQGRSIGSIVTGIALEYALSERQVWVILGTAPSD